MFSLTFDHIIPLSIPIPFIRTRKIKEKQFYYNYLYFQLKKYCLNTILHKPERPTYGAEISSHANERHNMVINFIRIWQSFGSNLWWYDSWNLFLMKLCISKTGFIGLLIVSCKYYISKLSSDIVYRLFWLNNNDKWIHSFLHQIAIFHLSWMFFIINRVIFQHGLRCVIMNWVVTFAAFVTWQKSPNLYLENVYSKKVTVVK